MQISKSTITFFLFLFSTSAFSQMDSTKKRINPAHIRTQGEQEEYWAQEIFDKKYETQHFDRYKGSIALINKNTIRYDESIITAGFIQEEYRTIFENGIIYPSIFSGYNDGRILEVQKKPDSANHNPLYFLSGNDSLSIGIMEEFKFLNPSVTIKRYKLYLAMPGFANPSIYVFELTNENATNTTDLKTFLNWARLTFLKFVSILI